MSEQASHKCDCAGAKKIKSLEKQIAELKLAVEQLSKEMATLRKAVRR